ncbi:vesicle-associated membrane protein [Anaeramoeba ignava]|uniref:Vesicle-associated membrane protein n=1 Tax=Anaeramoeba ignava TaxID=1746090 RepID=A0A9Q0LBI3_ANAIG|nr:vesicle-associated membrane protein [Anaeramoeba ignava]
MSILCALVGSPKAIYSFYAVKGHENLLEKAEAILAAIGTENSRVCYVYESYNFLVRKAEDEVIYICAADEMFGKRIPFAFLAVIRNEFERKYLTQAENNERIEEFDLILEREVNYFSNEKDYDNILKTKKELDELKSIMDENLEKIVQRGGKLDTLIDKTDKINKKSYIFKKQATTLKRKMWWKDKKMLLILLVIILIIWKKQDDKIVLIDDSIQALTKLSQKHQIFIITYCKDKTEKENLEQLYEEFGLFSIGIPKIQFLYHSTKEGKIAFVRQLTSAFHIDYEFDVLKELKRLHIPQTGLITENPPLEHEFTIACPKLSFID